MISNRREYTFSGIVKSVEQADHVFGSASKIILSGQADQLTIYFDPKLITKGKT